MMVSKLSKSSCDEDVADVLSALDTWDSGTSSSTTGLCWFSGFVWFLTVFG